MDQKPLTPRFGRRAPTHAAGSSVAALTAIILASTIGSASACSGAGREGIAQGTQAASAELRSSDGQRIGEASLREGPHGVHVQIRLDGAPGGARAMHVHETGQCEPGFDAAGSHWNPHSRQHGFMNPEGPHAGDLPNLHIPDNGRLDAEFFLPGARLHGFGGLLDGDGTALVMHAGADDHRTDPSGDSGERLACGVIRG